eukprot:scaffold74395_cov16-Tisochrysis_lutea.AAC.2
MGARTKLGLFFEPHCKRRDAFMNFVQVAPLFFLIPTYAQAVMSAGDVQRAATMLANLAQQHAGDSEFQSPYVKEALSQGWVCSVLMAC